MLALTLLLAQAPLVQFNLESGSSGQVELKLCLQGSGQQVRYELLVRRSGESGTAQSRQSGQARADAHLLCPVRSVQAVRPDTRVDARLRWWLDGIEQPEMLKTYP